MVKHLATPAQMEVCLFHGEKKITGTSARKSAGIQVCSIGMAHAICNYMCLVSSIKRFQVQMNPKKKRLNLMQH